MIRKGEYSSKYTSVKYDRSHDSIKEISDITSKFSTYYKVVVQDKGLIIIDIRNLSSDKMFVRENDIVIVDEFGVRVIKKEDVNSSF